MQRRKRSRDGPILRSEGRKVSAYLASPEGDDWIASVDAEALGDPDVKAAFDNLARIIHGSIAFAQTAAPSSPPRPLTIFASRTDGEASEIARTLAAEGPLLMHALDATIQEMAGERAPFMVALWIDGRVLWFSTLAAREVLSRLPALFDAIRCEGTSEIRIEEEEE